MAKAESLGVVLTLSNEEATYLKEMTGKQTGTSAKALFGENGNTINQSIYGALLFVLTGEVY